MVSIKTWVTDNCSLRISLGMVEDKAKVMTSLNPITVVVINVENNAEVHLALITKTVYEKLINTNKAVFR